MVVMSVFLLLAVVMFGIVFLRLHTLPERMAHKSKKMQFEIVAVLGLIALFTHMHIFWIAGLLLAMIDLPDFGTSLGRIAASTEQLAGIKPSDGSAERQSKSITDAKSTTDVERFGSHDGAPLEKNEPRSEGNQRVVVYSSDMSFAREKS